MNYRGEITMKKEFYKTSNFWVGLILVLNLVSLFGDKLMSGSWWWHLFFGFSGVCFLTYVFISKNFNKKTIKSKGLNRHG